MMSIIAVETAILQAATVALPDLKDAASLPGNWTADTLKKAIQMAPGVYVSFLGGSNSDYRGAEIDARFDVYLVSKGAIEHYRRDHQPGGAYGMVSAMLPVLHKMTVPDVGVLRLNKVSNLFKDALFNLGGTVYAINLSIPLYFDPPPVNEPLATNLHFTLPDEETVVLS